MTWTATGSWTERLDRQIHQVMSRDQNPFWQWILSNFDVDEYAVLQKKYDAIEFATQSKFLAAGIYLPKKWHDVKQFPPQSRVLDLGCGPGHIGVIGRYVGHEVLGLDAPGQLCFDATCAFWRSPKVDHIIVAYEPLPDLGRFDVVTSYLTKFGVDWGGKEWDFLIDNCLVFADQLIVDVPGARIALKKYFASRCSAVVGKRKFIFRKGPDA